MLEHQLRTCDLTMFIDTRDQNASLTSRDKQLRVVVVSASSVTGSRLAETLLRIEHLAAISCGDHVAIVFSIQAAVTADMTHQDDALSPTIGLAKLQAEILTSTTLPAVPVLLMIEFKDLPKMVKAHCMALNRPAKSKTIPKAIDLLPRCKVGPALDGFAIPIISELFHSLKDLSCAMALPEAGFTPGESGCSDNTSSIAQTSKSRLGMMEDQLGLDVLEAMMEFWTEELSVE